MEKEGVMSAATAAATNTAGSGTPPLLSVTRCKSDTSTLLAMHRSDCRARRRRSSSRGSAGTMPVMSARHS